MTCELRKILEDLSMKAYGTTGRYKKIQRDGIVSDMEIVEDDAVRKYRGYKHPNDQEMILIMQDIITAKEEQAKKEAVELEAEQNRFANIPKPELQPFNAEVTANAGTSSGIQETEA
jgi:hypothetical protein